MNCSFIFWSLLIAYKRGNYQITSFASYLLMTLIFQLQSIMQKMNNKSKNINWSINGIFEHVFQLSTGIYSYCFNENQKRFKKTHILTCNFVCLFVWVIVCDYVCVYVLKVLPNMINILYSNVKALIWLYANVMLLPLQYTLAAVNRIFVFY